MSLPHRVEASSTSAAVDPAAAAPPRDAEATISERVAASNRSPRTRTGIVWFGLCAAIVTFVVLIVFMAQNTRGTEVTFLWMHGTLPLALALLIAGVGSALLTMVVGVARITQLRRFGRRQR